MQYKIPGIIVLLLSKWHYLLISMLISLCGGYIFLRLVHPEYRAEASLKVEERRSELSELLNIRNLYDKTSKTEAEKTIIRSKAVLQKAIASMDYRISYFKSNGFNYVEIYPDKPLKIQILQQDEIAGTGTVLFKVEPLNSKKFKLSYRFLKRKVSDTMNYGEKIKLPGLIFILHKNARSFSNTPYLFTINHASELIKRIRASLNITDNPNTNILEISLTDQNPFFARDMLNAIVKEYQQYDKFQRSVSNQQATLFIDTLLSKMADAVKTAGAKIETFKSGHQMLNLASSMEVLLQQLTALGTEKHNLMTRHYNTLQLKKILSDNVHLQKLNGALQGVDDPQLLTLLNKLNEQLEKRTQTLLYHLPTSPVVAYIDIRIEELKRAMQINVHHQIRNETAQLASLNHDLDKIKISMQQIPKTEMTYIHLQSAFNVQQKVYDYLAEKKLETQISAAAVVSRVQIIDQATAPIEPIYPIKTSIYTDFGLAGILAGILAVFIQRTINPYLHEVREIESICNLPMVGNIRNYTSKTTITRIPAIELPTTPFSESIRALRANLNFICTEKPCKVICITSEIAGEGKSFCALNLAGVYSNAGKKVVIIAADLRKSTLHQIFKVKNQHGLSGFLAGQTSFKEICIKTNVDHLYFIASGPVPPNPSELLQNDHMSQLLQQLASLFDYIIIDSPPVGLVSDALPLMKLADVNLFMFRCGVSRRQAALLPQKLQKEAGLSNLYLVLNSFEKSRYAYNELGPADRYFKDYYCA